jgi:transcriptional regulator with XRE-family HTH domain
MSVIKYGGNLPTFVRRLRDDLDMTQSELAGRMGVHKQYVSNVERGLYENPVGFCALLFGVCPPSRIPYLTDLIAEAGAARNFTRLKSKVVKRKRK